MGSSEVEARLSGEGDDDSEAEQVTSRARLRIAELLERPFDMRSVALTGLFILAVFYTIYFLRSMLLPIVLAWLLDYLVRPIVRTLADQDSNAPGRRLHPDYASFRDHLGRFSVSGTGCRLAGETAHRFAGVAIQALANEAIDGRGSESDG